MLVLPLAGAQVALDQANSLRFARFTELVRNGLVAASYAPSEELAQTLLEDYLPLFAGSLGAVNPKLLKSLEDGLKEMRMRIKQKRSLGQVVPRVEALLEQVQQTLIPARTRGDPVFQAALISQLLSLDDGVSESYNDAANGQASGYIRAWAGLQRVKALWRPLRQQWAKQTEVVGKTDEALAALADFLPSPTPPARLSNPDDVQEMADEAGFALEKGAGIPLEIRDLPKVWELVKTYANQGCAAAQNRRQNLAQEWILSAHLYYRHYLEDALRTLEPTLQKPLSDMLGQLLPDHLARGYGIQGECARLQTLLLGTRDVLK
jgi:hypothetical protein